MFTTLREESQESLCFVELELCLRIFCFYVFLKTLNPSSQVAGGVIDLFEPTAILRVLLLFPCSIWKLALNSPIQACGKSRV
jgi:hypothetical protein